MTWPMCAATLLFGFHLSAPSRGVLLFRGQTSNDSPTVIRPADFRETLGRGTDNAVFQCQDSHTCSLLGTHSPRGRRYDLFFEWSDSRIYCSELVWKAYDRALGIQIGKMQKIRELNLADAAVRAKLRERYGERVPLDEPVISPAPCSSRRS